MSQCECSAPLTGGPHATWCPVAAAARLAASKMTTEQHRARHVELHKMLDELVADWMTHTGKRPSSSSVLELLEWSNTQTVEPTEKT